MRYLKQITMPALVVREKHLQEANIPMLQCSEAVTSSTIAVLVSIVINAL